MWSRLLIIFGLSLVSVPVLADVVETKERKLSGVIEWRKTDMRVFLPAGGVERVRLSDVTRIRHKQALEEADRIVALEAWKSKAETLSEGDAPAWLALADWCLERRMAAEARSCFEKAVGIEAGNERARHALGFVKEGADWVPAREVFEKKLEAGGGKQLMNLSKWAKGEEQDDLEWDALRRILAVDAFHAAALKSILRQTASYVQVSSLCPPFAGRWKALPDPTRHHQLKKFALHAIDFVKVDAEGRSYKGPGNDLSDHYCWDEPIYATGDGTVMVVKDGFKDNRIGEFSPWQEANLVALYHGEREYSIYVHLKKGSIGVKEGDIVKRGQLIARVGNSGASSAPHLHYALNDPDAISIPFAFEDYDWLLEGRTVRIDCAALREGWTVDVPAPAGGE